MHFKRLFLALLIFVTQAGAAEFRFECLAAGTTGLSHRVYDADGKETKIIITKDSNAESRKILAALVQKQVFGTKGVEDHQDAKWEQGIILTGNFASKTKRTASGPNTAAPEKYREFRITGIKVLFPVSRFEVAAGGNQIDGPMIIETHLSFHSLFPRGLTFNGKPIDLGKHERRRDGSK